MPLDMPQPPDLAMELLCLLTPRPAFVASLADDLGVELDTHVLTLAKRLRRQGYAVFAGDIRGLFSQSKGERQEALWVELHGWAEASEAAQKWWDQTREEGVCAC